MAAAGTCPTRRSGPRRQALLDSKQLVVLGGSLPLAGAPDLIWPAFVATARCEMNESSVSPERWLTIRPKPACSAVSIVWRVSESVPI